jgi:hypothetical protein
MPRLSSQALYALRNHINIDRLMTQVLQIPTQQINGMGRFQCPLCARFHTATHPHTNLARCFDCQKNFNTIELVMAVRHIRFLEAVALLQRYQKILANRSHLPQSQRVSPNTRASPNPNPLLAPADVSDAKAKTTQQQPTSTKAASHLIAIKQILNKL